MELLLEAFFDIIGTCCSIQPLSKPTLSFQCIIRQHFSWSHFHLIDTSATCLWFFRLFSCKTRKIGFWIIFCSKNSIFKINPYKNWKYPYTYRFFSIHVRIFLYDWKHWLPQWLSKATPVLPQKQMEKWQTDGKNYDREILFTAGFMWHLVLIWNLKTCGSSSAYQF